MNCPDEISFQRKLYVIRKQAHQQLHKSKLLEWEEKDNILRVLLVGEGKHFCAGGDVKSLVLAGKENSLKHDFFKIEYKLNYLISQFSKEFLSVWNGVVMGGGVGLSIYGDHRLATDNSKFAMPESAIGFFPDVGGSYFLSRLGKGNGLYLGLTGKTCNARDMMDLGLSTHYLPSEWISKAIKESLSGSISNLERYISCLSTVF